MQDMMLKKVQTFFVANNEDVLVRANGGQEGACALPSVLCVILRKRLVRFLCFFYSFVFFLCRCGMLVYVWCAVCRGVVF